MGEESHGGIMLGLDTQGVGIISENANKTRGKGGKTRPGKGGGKTRGKGGKIRGKGGKTTNQQIILVNLKSAGLIL